eukprot:gene5700-7094_t
MNSFEEEIQGAIDDISFGVNSIKILNDHPQSNPSQNIIILNVESKENQSFLIKMSMDTGFNVLDEEQSFDRSVQGMLRKKSQEEIINFAIKFCIDFRIEKPAVCEGIVPLFKNLTFDVIDADTPDNICGFIGYCPYSPEYQGNVTFPKPKPPHIPPVPPPKDSPTKTILHLSDIHMDTQYVAGMNNDCGEPLCCRAVNGPGTGSKAAGKWGDYHCDINELLLISMFDFIQQEFPNGFDYIFWTGDNPPHDVWMQSHGTQLNATARLTNFLLKYFPQPNTKVFPSIGNHEGVPVNSFPLPTGPNSSWLYNQLAVDWSQWLDDQAIETLKYGGYYTMSMEPGFFRVISLNMNWCNNQNTWLIVNATDAANMIQWTIDTLQASEDIGEKVFIVGHIPPGTSDCIDIWSQRFYQVVNRYEDTILGTFYGHTHNDQFELFYTPPSLVTDKSANPPIPSRATAIAYVTPSVTTFTNQNPSFRVYTIDANSYYPMESSTYHVDINSANSNDKPEWKLEYNATTAYNMPNLLPESWSQLISNFSSNRQFLQDTYYNFTYSSSPYPLKNKCETSCSLSKICEMKSGTHSLYKQCLASKANSLSSLIKVYHYLSTIIKSC